MMTWNSVRNSAKIGKVGEFDKDIVAVVEVR